MEDVRFYYRSGKKVHLEFEKAIIELCKTFGLVIVESGFVSCGKARELYFVKEIK